MKKNSIYKVEFEQRFKGVRGWHPDWKKVLANGDAAHAVAIAKRRALSEGYDEDGTWRQCIKFRYTGVERLETAEW